MGIFKDIKALLLKNKRGSLTYRTMHDNEFIQFTANSAITFADGTKLGPTQKIDSREAAKLEGFDFIGIEMDAEYHKIAAARIAAIPEKLL